MTTGMCCHLQCNGIGLRVTENMLVNVGFIFSATNKMQHYTIFFITVNALHVSGGFSAHHQELKKTVHTASGICQACLLLPLAWVSWNSPTLVVAASKLDIYLMLCVQFF